MSDTVAVALIAGSAGVLGGLVPSVVAWRAAAAESRRSHRAWLRDQRFAAYTAVFAEATSFGQRGTMLRIRHEAGDRDGVELAAWLTAHVEELNRQLAKVAVLGPDEMASAALDIGQAAIVLGAAYLRQGYEEQLKATEAMKRAEDVFQTVGRRLVTELR